MQVNEIQTGKGQPHKTQLNKKRKNSRQALIFIWGSLAIPIVHFLVFWLYVNFDSLLLAFRTFEGGKQVFSLQNFRDVFARMSTDTGDLSIAIKNTFIFFGFGLIFTFLNLFCAFVLYKKILFKSFFRFMFYVPTIISAVVISGLFKYMVNPMGPIGVLYTHLTGNPAPAFLLQKEYALKTVMAYTAFVGFAGNILLLGGAMARIPQSVVESAYLDGIGWFREFVQICLPLIWGTLSTLIILMMSNIFNSSGEILLLTGGRGDTTTISYWMFSQIKYYNSYNLPSAFGWLLTLVAVPISLITRKIVNNIYKDVEV